MPYEGRKEVELNQTEKNLDATREENSECKKECFYLG